MNIETSVPLAPFTTIKLGGAAQEFASCETNQDIIDVLTYAQEKKSPLHILGGGSNTLFADSGFSGLVMHVQLKGITHTEQSDGSLLITAQAGEEWDSVVQYAIAHNATGIECLSGIPGSVGGTPFQNVGAYGQDVSQTIQTVFTINRETFEHTEFSNQECNFGYRTSIFKEGDRDKYIITAVAFRLETNKAPEITYPELQNEVGEHTISSKEGLQQVRNAVLRLRKKKSMVIDPQDPNSISCGSFFTNPIISVQEFEHNTALSQSDIPNFPEPHDRIKLSAGWLIEHAGFSKGMKFGNVGISENHNLALVNRSGTTQEMLAFAQQIQDAIEEKFTIHLQLEPVVIA